MDEYKWLFHDSVREMLDHVMLHRSRCCGCLWRINPDDSLSLAPNQTARPCCDNVPFTHDRLISDRKLRLFAVALCKQAWHLMPDPRSSQAILIAEAYADGEATQSDLEDAEREATFDNLDDDIEIATWMAAWVADNPNTLHEVLENGLNVREIAPAQTLFADLLRDIVPNPFYSTTFPARRSCGCQNGWFIRGNGERFPCSICKGTNLDWRTPDVLDLAQAAYKYNDDQRGKLDLARLFILSDAMEESGCTDVQLLRHLRDNSHRGDCYVCQRHHVGQDCPHCEGGIYAHADSGMLVNCDACRATGKINFSAPHVRGCWVLDLILGKS